MCLLPWPSSAQISVSTPSAAITASANVNNSEVDDSKRSSVETINGFSDSVAVDIVQDFSDGSAVGIAAAATGLFSFLSEGASLSVGSNFSFEVSRDRELSPFVANLFGPCGVSGVAAVELRFFLFVTGEAQTFSFSASLDGEAEAPGRIFTRVSAVILDQFQQKPLEVQLLCDQGICAPTPLSTTVVLEPGSYTVVLKAQAVSGQGNSNFRIEGLDYCGANATASGSFRFETAVCSREWVARGANAAFDDPENWSPAGVPTDLGNGCENLSVDPFATAMFLRGSQTANTLRINSGAVQAIRSLGGATLGLGGRDGTGSFSFGLDVEGTAIVEEVRVETDNVLINGVNDEIAQLIVGRGAVLKGLGEDGEGIVQVGEPGNGRLIVQEGAQLSSDFRLGSGVSRDDGQVSSEIILEGNRDAEQRTLLDGPITVLNTPGVTRVGIVNGADVFSDTTIDLSGGGTAPGNTIDIVGRHSVTGQRARMRTRELIAGSALSELDARVVVRDGELSTLTTRIGGLGPASLSVSGDAVFAVDNLFVGSSAAELGAGRVFFTETAAPSEPLATAQIEVRQSTELGLSSEGFLQISAVPSARPARAVVMNRIVLGNLRNQGNGTASMLVAGRALDAREIEIRGRARGHAVFEIRDGGSVFVSDGDNGTLTVGAGGFGDLVLFSENPAEATSLTTVFLQVGSSNGEGNLRVFGVSNVNARNLIVPIGSNATGTVTIEEGAIVGVQRTVDIGFGGRGSVRLSGAGVLSAGDGIDLGANGVLELRSDTTVTTPRVNLSASGARLIGIAATDGKQDEAAPRITGDLAMVDGAVLQLLAVPGAPALRIEGDFVAGGVLDIRFPGNAALAENDTFFLLDVLGQSGGSFSAVNAPGRSSDFEARVEAIDGQWRLTVLTPGEPVDTGEGEREGDEEGEGETEGEGEETPEPPPAGCQGCFGDESKALDWRDQLGNYFLGMLTGLCFLYLHLRQRPARAIGIVKAP